MSYVKKLKLHEFNIWQKNNPFFSQIDIELTERCNNNCIHCFINKLENDSDAVSKEMSTDFIKGILTEAANLGCLKVRFTGGEPLLRFDFPDLYIFARRLGLQVILFTNARLITENLAQMLAEYPPGHPVEVSVYGMSSESYDRVSQCEGSFLEFKRGVDLMLKHKVPFIVKSPKLHFLKNEQEAFESWAKTIPSMDSSPGYSMNFDLRSRRDDPKKNARIKKLRATPEETVEALSSHPLYISSMREFCSRFIGPPGVKLFQCGAGEETCVDAYGQAQLCLPLRSSETVVNLYEYSLKKALAESFPSLRGIVATNKEYVRRCARCFLMCLCEQCPAKSWMEHGTLDTPVEYFCEVAHAQARFLGLIATDEKAWEVVNWKQRVELFVNDQ